MQYSTQTYFTHTNDQLSPVLRPTPYHIPTLPATTTPQLRTSDVRKIAIQKTYQKTPDVGRPELGWKYGGAVGHHDTLQICKLWITAPNLFTASIVEWRGATSS
jgi:hypothetical protein